MRSLLPHLKPARGPCEIKYRLPINEEENMDLSKLSIAELRALEARVSGLVEKAQKREREAAIERIYAVAHGLKMPLKTILASGANSTKTSRKGNKYQDPKNPANTWVGKGARPAWLKAALAVGVALDSLLVRG
jgi:DNA-binding protein H-NS